MNRREIMSLEVLKMNTNNIINPFTWIKDWYHNTSAYTEFKLKYDLRNPISAIKPFLDSLGSEYLVVQDDLIIIENSTELKLQLTKLGFKPLLGYHDAQHKHFDILKQTCNDLFVDIVYQEEYNFELFIIKQSDWILIKTVQRILSKLKTKPADYFIHFMYVLRELEQHG